MKKKTLLFLIALVMPTVVFAMSEEYMNSLINSPCRYPNGFTQNGVVRKKETAIAIAEAVAKEVYGDDRVRPFLPFASNEQQENESRWYISAIPFINSSGKQDSYSNGPQILIDRYDGEIIYTFYFK